MGRIEQCFSEAKTARRKVLVAYINMGFPTLEVSRQAVLTAANAGADILEIGVPFSDPVADGPIIAEASSRAIQQGVNLPQILETIRELRKELSQPMVLFSYYNPLLIYGEAKLARDAAQAGVDALLVVDLPPEEGTILRTAAKEQQLAMIPLLTPVSNPARVQSACQDARGFIYYVSVTGITGTASAPLEEAPAHAERLRSGSGLPVVVGFGIDSPAKAKQAAGAADAGADGVVVGTAIVRQLFDHPPETALEKIGALVRSLREGLDG
jgi:tryptophan synthase alpha chain